MLTVVLMGVSGSLSDLEWSAGMLSHACTGTLSCGMNAGLGTVEGVGHHELDKLGSCKILFPCICWLVIDLSLCAEIPNVQLCQFFIFIVKSSGRS